MRLDVLLELGLLAATAAAELVYITDLTAFSSLAPCAASAVSYVVQGLTESQCPPAVTALESCVCTNNQNSAGIAASISSNVLESCGSTATDDITSASQVFGGYCNQAAAAATTPVPAPTLVFQYITDLQAFSDLAGCAASALSYVVQDFTNTDCPPGQSALASCACSKNQNSLAASEGINTQVLYSCGPTHSADLTSAQAVFSGYCGLNHGTSNFPTPSALAGSLTYYITDLPQYSSLAPCAGTAVSSIILSQTYDFCGTAPDALASCVCVKDQNIISISSALVSEVSYQCGSTVDSNESSAIDVLSYYCSAAEGQVHPTGITNSVAGATYGGSAQTAAGSARISVPTASSTSSAAAGADSSSGLKPSGGVKVGVIAGGIAGGVAVIIIAAVAILFYRRRRQRLPPLSTVGGASGSGSSDPTDSKIGVELHQYTKMSTPPLKPQGMHEVPGDQKLSDYAISEMPTPTSPEEHKLGMGGPPKQSPYQAYGHIDPVYEMQGRPQNQAYEMPGRPQYQAYEMPGRPQNQAYEMPIGHADGRIGYQAGPVYEMYAPLPAHSPSPSPI